MAGSDSSKDLLRGQPAAFVVGAAFSSEYLNACFRYNLRTGELFWRKRPKEHFSSESIWRRWNTKYALKEAGQKKGNGLGKECRSVCLNRQHLLTHNVILGMEARRLPIELVGYINGSSLDNSWGNLREISHKENNKNRRRGTANAAGVVGVSRCMWSGKWRAQIAVNGGNTTLGLYRDFFDAVCARKSADVKYGGHVNQVSVGPL